MTTEELMNLALAMVQMEKVPPDSAIHVQGKDIHRVLFAIDVSQAELLYAKEKGFDCVIGHHPRGLAQARYYDILQKQISLLEALGVPKEEAVEATKTLRETFFLNSHRANWEEVVRIAEKLPMPFLNIHNPLDELGRRLMAAKIAERQRPGWKIGDLLSALQEFEEIRKAPLGPYLAMGDLDNDVGKVAVFHGTGTNGGYGAAHALFKNGYQTVLYIHIDSSDLEKLRKEDRGNLIISGHIASDMIGINPYLQELEKRGLTVEKLSIF